MTFYIFVENEKLNGCGQARQLTDGVRNLEVEKALYNAYAENPDMYIWDGEAVVENPNYAEEQAQKEAERVAKLTCTKRVFALMLQELGISYTMLKELIATNEQAQLEWDLCVELERSNPLLDVMALQLGITAGQLDGLFRYANGELTINEFRALYVKADDPIEETEELVVEPVTGEDVTQSDPIEEGE